MSQWPKVLRILHKIRGETLTPLKSRYTWFTNFSVALAVILLTIKQCKQAQQTFQQMNGRLQSNKPIHPLKRHQSINQNSFSDAPFLTSRIRGKEIPISFRFILLLGLLLPRSRPLHELPKETNPQTTRIEIYQSSQPHGHNPDWVFPEWASRSRARARVVTFKFLNVLESSRFAITSYEACSDSLAKKSQENARCRSGAAKSCFSSEVVMTRSRSCRNNGRSSLRSPSGVGDSRVAEKTKRER